MHNFPRYLVGQETKENVVWVSACPILDICAGARIFLSMSAVITWAVSSFAWGSTPNVGGFVRAL